MCEANLWFTGDPLQLYRWEFCSHDGAAHLAFRGKTAGAYTSHRTFQWTSAVKALSLLLLKVADASAQGKNLQEALIEGKRGSLASSLDDALYKEPQWLADLFGTDKTGAVLAKYIFRRTNPGRKRPGPVAISLNTKRLDPFTVKIFVDGAPVCASEKLSLLWQTLESENRQSPLGLIRCNSAKRTNNAAVHLKPIPGFLDTWKKAKRDLHTSECIQSRAIVLETEALEWYRSLKSRIYMLASKPALNGSISRLYVLQTDETARRYATLINAQLNELLGVHVRFVEQSGLSSIIRTSKSETRSLVTDCGASERFDELFDSIMNDASLSLPLSKLLALHPKCEQIRGEAAAYYSLLPSLEAAEAV